METGILGTARPASLAGDTPDEAAARAVLAGQEQERARLAEELHDGPAQALANAIFQVEVVGQAVRRDVTRAELELAALRDRLQRELESLRAYINQLRPALGEEAGLEDALRDSAGQLAERAGIPVEVRLEAPSSELDEASRVVVLRVAQEALRNVAKHADASRAWVSTSHARTPGGVRRWVLEVRDDGQGFDVDAAREHAGRRHFGLRFMRERAELLGAELTIQAEPAAGTVIRLSIDTGEGEER